MPPSSMDLLSSDLSSIENVVLIAIFAAHEATQSRINYKFRREKADL